MSSNVFRWKRKRAGDAPEPKAPPTPPHSGVNSSAASVNSATYSTGSAPTTPNDRPPMPLQRSFTESVVVQDGKSDPVKIKGLRRTPSWLTGAFSSKSPNKSTASTSVSKESILGDSVRSEKPDLVRFPRRSSDTSSLQGRARSGSELSQIPESGISDYFDGKSPELAAFLQNREKPPTSEPSIPEATTAPHATTAPIPIESKPQPKVRSMLEVDPDSSPKSQVQPEVIEKPSETAVGVQSDARSETKVEVGPENKPTPKLRSMLDVDLSPEATPGVKSDVKLETRQEMGSENKLEVKPGGFPERRPSTRSSRSEPKLETMYEVDEPAPDVKPETKPEIKTDAAPVIVPKSESMPDIGSELRPGIIRELRPETKPHIEVEANADVKPDVTVDVEADAKADAKPEEVKPDPKPEVKIDSSPVPKPEVRVDTKSQLRPVTKPRAKSSNDQGESDLAYPSTPRSSTWGDWLAWTQFTESQPNYKSHAVAAPQNTESPQERADRLRPNTASNSRSIDFDYSDDQPQSSLLSDLWDTAQRTVEAAIESRWPSSPKETSCKDSEDGWERYYPLPSRDQEPAQHQEATSKVGSNWGFWSKDRQDNEASVAEPAIKETVVQSQGVERSPPRTMESKVAESASQDTKEITADNCLQGSGTSTWARLPRVRSRSGSLRRHSASFSGTSTPTGLESPKLNSPGRPIPEAEVPLKAQRNLLLPSFSSTYRMKENPSILKQAARFLFGTKRPLEQPVYRTTDTPRIRKAVAIGVHGLFPAPYLRPMIGQPTGTSVRFAGLCADAIKKWADANGSSDCEIEKIALEGDGKIGDRVENLWKLLLNWADAIRSADLVIIACHSQGVPVSVILLEKLIDLGIITRNRVGVCAMAGVSLGPFADYRSGIFSGSAAELWDFGKRDSAISKRFELALKRVLDHGAHITFVGAIDDQVVPLESAIYSPANHPNIYRAVFIDGRVHASDFISHLVGFALKLRNLGVSDHGLIRELSVPLAGSLYSGEGHSRLYYDSQVYDLAISHALQTTTPTRNAPCTITHHDGESNPYLLPWIMRGLLEENYVKTELSGESEEILRQFDAWRPTNKALKDVKYRLEAVRSKL